jgi:hypothetical protein
MVLKIEDARLPTAVPFARVAVGSVSAIYMLCNGVHPNEKTIPNRHMKVIVVLAADALERSFVAILEVPVMISVRQKVYLADLLAI